MRSAARSSATLHRALIVAPPRSGSTLLGWLLAGGDATLSLSEPLLLHAFAPDWKLQRFFWRYERQAGLDRLRPPYGATPERFMNFLHALGRPQQVKTLVVKETFRSPADWAPWRNVELLTELIRQQPSVALTRDPLDVVASSVRKCRGLMGIRGRLVRLRWPALPLFRDADQATQAACENWRAFMTWARERKLSMFRYEDLLASPAEQLARICAQLEIPYSERMLDLKHPRPTFGGLGDPDVIHRAPRPLELRNPGRGVGLTPAQRQVVHAVCGSMAREFGYLGPGA